FTLLRLPTPPLLPYTTLFRSLEAAGKDPVNNRRATNLGTFRAYVVAYLRSHPGVNQDMTLLVRQRDPTAQGIPLEIYCFSADVRSEEHTSELQSRENLVCRLL